eukprot:6178488-Pleurochrysis_carterae.AAC.3
MIDISLQCYLHMDYCISTTTSTLAHTTHAHAHTHAHEHEHENKTTRRDAGLCARTRTGFVATPFNPSSLWVQVPDLLPYPAYTIIGSGITQGLSYDRCACSPPPIPTYVHAASM